MRSPRLIAAMLVPGLLTCACGHGERSGRAVGPAAALNAGGEPQWSVLLRRGVLRFSAADAPSLAIQAERVDHGAAGVSWSGVLPGKPGAPGGRLRLTTLAKPCQDAATGMSYPFRAAVEVQGRRYVGCAAPAGQGLGPRS